MLVLFQADDEEHPLEIPMQYDKASGQYIAVSEKKVANMPCVLQNAISIAS